MILKKFQQKVVARLDRFVHVAAEEKYNLKKANIPAQFLQSINWVEASFKKSGVSEAGDYPVNGVGERYPRLCIKVPTGGGKTLLAIEAIRLHQHKYVNRKTGLVIWIVPSETIYTQTVDRIRDKAHPYRQLVDQISGGNTVILEKGQTIRKTDIANNLVILFIMIQSVNRKTKESLKVFEDSGAYDSFFPADNRYDLHKELLEKVSNLDTFAGIEALQPQVKTSLGNMIRITQPLMIVDEFHKVFTPQAKETIDGLNPSMVLGFSATPKSGTNILVRISGQELKDEEMIKLDMHLKPPVVHQDWQGMTKEIKDWRDKLEEKAISYTANSGRYIRPMALFQVERTGKDQRGKGFVHSEDLKEYLINLGVPAHEIAIKTSSVNDIEDVNLFSRDCEIRYIITKEALKEGWDCSYAYILGIIPNVNSNQGTTQLVGRILRQPYAEKTEIKELDESYVYFANGRIEKILKQIQIGFKEEGLEDLVRSVNASGDSSKSSTKIVPIRKEFSGKYPHSLYLPVWLIKTGRSNFRRFNYEIDIRSKLDYSLVDINKVIKTDLVPLLSKQLDERQESIITIEHEDFLATSSHEKIMVENMIDVNYLTRRLQEHIDNSFIAYSCADYALKRLYKLVDEDLIRIHSGFIVQAILQAFEGEKKRQEQAAFLDYLNKKDLILAVSDEDRVGYSIPKKDLINNSQYGNRYHSYLYEDFDFTQLNDLEITTADTLDKQTNILWWFRNKVRPNWYAIEGWKRGKIRPDFVAAKKDAKGKLRLVYVLESKGEHLVGNEDTEYKRKVFDLLNKTEIIQVKSMVESQQKIGYDINKKYEYVMVNAANVQGEVQGLFVE